MDSKLITVADLQVFKVEMLREIKKLLANAPAPLPKRWLKSHEVQKILRISPGTLQHLRDSGQLKFSKVGGIVFFEMKDIEEMMGRVGK